MSSKKELCEEINELLPNDDDPVDISKLKKAELEKLKEKIDLLWAAMMGQSEKAIDDLLAKKGAKFFQKHWKLTDEETATARSVMARRFDEGPFFKLGKKFLKKKLLDAD